MKKGCWQWYATLFFFHDMSSICIYGYGSVCYIALFSHVHYVWIYTCISSVENGLMIDFVLVNVEGVRICFKTWLQIFGSFWFICLLTLFIGFFLLLISVSYETEKKKKTWICLNLCFAWNCMLLGLAWILGLKSWRGNKFWLGSVCKSPRHCCGLRL